MPFWIHLKLERNTSNKDRIRHNRTLKDKNVFLFKTYQKQEAFSQNVFSCTTAAASKVFTNGEYETDC